MGVGLMREVRDQVIRRVQRPAVQGSPEFGLAYVRTGPRRAIPTLVIPGGPGLASIVPYGSVRRQAAADGLDVIMVEHRGVGFSRADVTGVDLPESAMWVDLVLDDIAAVLDQEGIAAAYIAGSSYGSYLASSFAVKYPERVAGMLLDSALQSTKDLALEREEIRRLFWETGSPVGQCVRELTARGEDQRVLLDVVRSGYELSGMPLVESAVSRKVADRFDPVWQGLALYAARDESIAGIPYFYEFERAGTIGFRELNYGAVPDGLPLDPALTYARIADRFPSFEGELFDLPAETSGFHWPMVVLSGTRDVRTPPAIAERTVALAPNATLARIENGHSALDSHPVAFVKALKLLVTGQSRRLPGLENELNRLPRRGLTADLAKAMELLAKTSRSPIR